MCAPGEEFTTTKSTLRKCIIHIYGFPTTNKTKSDCLTSHNFTNQINNSNKKNNKIKTTTVAAKKERERIVLRYKEKRMHTAQS